MHFFFHGMQFEKHRYCPKGTLYFWIWRASKYSPRQKIVVHSCHFLIHKGHNKKQQQKPHNLLILYHKKQDIFNIVKAEQNKRLM